MTGPTDLLRLAAMPSPAGPCGAISSRILEAAELALHFQPVVALSSGRMEGVEALLRWQSGADVLEGPEAILLAAREQGWTADLDEWVLNAACQQTRAWAREGLQAPRISVNISSPALLSGPIVACVEQALTIHGLAADSLAIEVSERALMPDMAAASMALRRLKGIGVQIILDEFGAGQTSLHSLLDLPLDIVKIDRSFVRDVTDRPQSVAMTRAVVRMAHDLRLKVLAVGVETVGQLALLNENHCDFIQGHLFSRPVDAPEIAKHLRSPRRLESLPVRQTHRTLLLVDDEESIVKSLVRLLRKDGYSILVANGAEEGLRRMAEHDVDVVVSDQRMPGMTGVEFLRRAKALYPETVRIVLSGYTELQSVTDAINEGAIYKFLTKPWDDDLLREQIAEAFRIRSLQRENVRLEAHLQTANQELLELNRRLQASVELQDLQIHRDAKQLHRSRDILDLVSVPVLGLDDERIVVLANAAAQRLLGDPEAGLIGRPLADFFAFDCVPEQMQSLRLSGTTYLVRCKALLERTSGAGWVFTLVPEASPQSARQSKTGEHFDTSN